MVLLEIHKSVALLLCVSLWGNNGGDSMGFSRAVWFVGFWLVARVIGSPEPSIIQFVTFRHQRALKRFLRERWAEDLQRMHRSYGVLRAGRQDRPRCACTRVDSDVKTDSPCQETDVCAQVWNLGHRIDLGHAPQFSTHFVHTWHPLLYSFSCCQNFGWPFSSLAS